MSAFCSDNKTIAAAGFISSSLVEFLKKGRKVEPFASRRHYKRESSVLDDAKTLNL